MMPVEPILIIIDALDESGNLDTRKRLLQILAGKVDDDENCITNLPQNFRFLVTSRPLPDICDALNGVKHVAQKSLDSCPPTDDDLLRYITNRFRYKRDTDRLGGEDFRHLARASGGLFGWAHQACGYIMVDYLGVDVRARFENLIKNMEEDNHDDGVATCCDTSRMAKLWIQAA
ncbi:hypothetical protein EDB19DRAFT_9806 [Suillus lakei]|nr:hypothetical protein EDB19DRAFT_9806 [Suillus lakei]